METKGKTNINKDAIFKMGRCDMTGSQWSLYFTCIPKRKANDYLRHEADARRGPKCGFKWKCICLTRRI